MWAGAQMVGGAVGYWCVLVYVDDIDVHYQQARSAGATILSEPEDDFPARRYMAEDLEGHRWMFMQKEKSD